MKDRRPPSRKWDMQAEMAAKTDPDARADPLDAEALYRAHAPFVASFLRHMGAAESDLDDFVQDVFVIAHRKGGYLPGPAAPRTWLASLAFRVVLARRRARARRSETHAHIDAVADDLRGPADVVDDRRSLRRVQDALQHLSAEQRAAFILFEVEGETCESIAAMWEVPIGTIYSRLHHARKRFLEVYKRAAVSKPVPRESER